MNKWMNDAQVLAQFGHSLGACLLVTFTTLMSISLGGRWPAVIVVVILGVIAAAVKEFWYDMKFELPTQTWWDSIEDFLFYMLGLTVGVGVTALAFHVANATKHC